jgi:hypothetical protein
MSDPQNYKETLYDALISQAADTLGSRGDLLPMAISVSRNGVMKFTIAIEGDREAFDQLVNRLRQEARAGEIKSAGVCIAATEAIPGIPEPRDIVVVFIEDDSGFAVRIHRPYKRSPTGDFDYGEPEAYREAPNIFA